MINHHPSDNSVCIKFLGIMNKIQELNVSLDESRVKSCYNPLRLGTVIVLVSSGIDFVNTTRLYSDRTIR